MKRSKKRVSKRKEAKIKSKSRYGSRSKIKKVKSKKIKSVKGGSGNASEEECKFLIKQLKDGDLNPLCKTNFSLYTGLREKEESFLKLYFTINISTIYPIFSYTKTFEEGDNFLDPFNIDINYCDNLKQYVETILNKNNLHKSKWKTFKEKWDSKKLTADITVDDTLKSDKDTFLKFPGLVETYNTTDRTYSSEKYYFKGPNFKAQIDQIL